jgi:hypothetical protein
MVMKLAEFIKKIEKLLLKLWFHFYGNKDDVYAFYTSTNPQKKKYHIFYANDVKQWIVQDLPN